MSVTANDLPELLKLIRSDPEWRAAVRREILTEELLDLPAQLEAFREETRQRFGDIERRIAIIEEDIKDIRRTQARMEGRLGSVEGRLSEQDWRNNFAGRFGRLVRRTRVVSPRDLDAFEEADEAGTITEQEALAVRQLDIIVEGVQGGRGTPAMPALLAVEVSVTIDRGDVARARDRAAILRKVGYNAIPVVAGARMDASLRDAAEAEGVRVLLRPEDVFEVA